MKPENFETYMRSYETLGDEPLPADVYVVARLDGRNFTRLTKELYGFECPFDITFRDLMVKTLSHLMQCGFRTVFGYSESDEISILLYHGDDTFGRKPRKWLSILASEASAKFSVELKDIAAFDCRLSLLPSISTVVDFFRWRMADASRNCTNSHCYWILRSQGKGVVEATKMLEGISNLEKRKIIEDSGTPFEEIPPWQKRGFGIHWEYDIRTKTDAASGEKIAYVRRNLVVNYNLPTGTEYEQFLIAHMLQNKKKIKESLLLGS